MDIKTYPNSSDRLFSLDWLRIIAFAVLALYHIGMYYVSWDFHVKSPFAGKTLEPWMKLTEPRRMSLIFLMIDDWYSHTMYFTMFAIGAMFASSQVTWAKLAAVRWIALTIAIACWGLFAFASTEKPIRSLIVSIFHWCAICAAFGFAKQHFNRDFRFRVTLTEAVFPVYVLHQTIIIVASQWLLPFRLPPAIEGPLLVTTTFTVSFALYALIKRFSLLRPCFGVG
jgi:glucans biosynthesis protein C